jgi:hypothetical protein
MASFAESAVAGYTLGSEIGTDIASGSILRDVYAGQTPETMSPEMQQGALNKAAVLAKSKGLDSLGYSFSKQANELGKANTQVELDKLKISEAQLSYAAQQLPLANSIDDIRTIVNSTVKDTNTKMFIERMLRDPNAAQNIPAIKEKLIEASRTESETIKAQQLTINGMADLEKRQNTKTDNDRADLKVAFDSGAPVPRSKYVNIYGEAATKAFEDKGMVFVDDSKKSTTTKTSEEAPSTFLGGRGAAEAPSYDTVAPGGALGKYGIKPATLDLARKLDPTLPKDNKAFLADPKAQDRAASVLEKANEKEIKDSGNKVTQVNKDLFWRFGAGDGTKILNAYDKNPNTKIEDVVGAQVIKENPDLANKTVAQAIAGNVSVDKQPAKEPTSFTKVVKPTAASIDRAGNIVENFMQASKDITSMARLPSTSRLGGLSDLGSKKGESLVTALSTYTARSATLAEEESFKRFASGFDAAMAIAIGGGFATSSSAARMKTYESQLPKAGQSMSAGIEFLARARQELETVNEGFQTRAGASEPQKKQMQKFLDDVIKAVPFTIEEVEKARFGGKESGTEAGKKFTGVGKKVAAEAEATAAGF